MMPGLHWDVLKKVSSPLENKVFVALIISGDSLDIERYSLIRKVHAWSGNAVASGRIDILCLASMIVNQANDVPANR